MTSACTTITRTTTADRAAGQPAEEGPPPCPILLRAIEMLARALPAALVGWWLIAGLLHWHLLVAPGFASLVWMVGMHCLEPLADECDGA